MELKNKIKEKLVIIPIFALAYLILNLLGEGCFIRLIFKTYCPFCGMTRAVLSLLRLDFASAVYFNPMVFSLPILATYYFFDGRVFKNRILNLSVLCLVFLGFIIFWILRLTGVTPQI